ncbi:Conserved oligomeric Golgi complex subunit [Geranomyces variabilis]|nr:Conserved oligomeric Golgi complex subunit [Geranomyces variabilis]
MLAARKQSVAPDLAAAASGTAAASSVDALLSSAEYKEFGQREFDSSQYANRVIQAPADSPFHGMDITTSLAKLSFGIEHLNKHIQEQVTSHYEDLLQQVTGLSRIEETLATVKQGVGSLNSSFGRVREKILVPHQEMRDKSLQLERIQSAAEVLRRVIRFMYLLRRLEVQLPGGERELPKAALTISELSVIIQDPDLKGIDVVDSEVEEIAQAKQRISTAGEQLLQRGMVLQNQTDIAAGLQVFHNLEQLSEKAQSVVNEMLLLITKEMQQALDGITLGKEMKDTSPRRAVGSPPSAAPIAVSVKLWQRLEHLMDVIYENFNKICQLYRVLKRKRDPTSHVLFLDEVSAGLDTDLLEFFAKGLASAFERELRMATKASQILLQQLQNGYPRLLRLTRNVFSRLAVVNGAGGASDAVRLDSTLMLRCLAPYETAYLSRSLSRLLEPVNSSFPDRVGIAARPPPNNDDVDKVVRTLGSELEAAKFDQAFVKTVSRNASKALKMFIQKSEQLCDVETGPISTAGTSTQAQMTVVETTNSLWHMQEGLWKQLQEFDEPVDESLTDMLRILSRTLQDIIEPLFAHITRDLEAVIVKIHREDLNGRVTSPSSRGPQGESPTSQYVIEFAGKIRWLHREILSKLRCGDASREWVRALGRRIVEYFLRHASLVRPANENVGRLLAGDMTQIEFVLSQWFAAMVMKLERDLSDSYRALRGFRHMPFLTLPEIPPLRKSQNLPPTILVHHLIARAHPAIPLPTTLYAWNEAQYSDWLDLHSQDEAVLILERCLDSYASGVEAARKRGGEDLRAEYETARTVLAEWKEEEERGGGR